MRITRRPQTTPKGGGPVDRDVSSSRREAHTPLVARARVVAVVTLLAGLTLLPYGSAATGDDRVLVVLATQGPVPYPAEQVESVARDVQELLHRSSSGRLSVRFDVTRWLSAYSAAPGCGGLTDASLDGLIAPARNAAAQAGYALNGYDQVVYALPQMCGFHGLTWGEQILLTREPTVELLAHELGHAFGLGHGEVSLCAVGCEIESPADPYTIMGTGLSLMDFSVYEKSVLGWIPRQPHAASAGTYTLAPAPQQTKLAQALVVDTAEGQWWFEYRVRPFRGLLVRFVDVLHAVPPFAPSSVLILRPSHAGRDWMASGETYRVTRSFSVSLIRAQTRQATLRLRWLSTRRSAGH